MSLVVNIPKLEAGLGVHEFRSLLIKDKQFRAVGRGEVLQKKCSLGPSL